MKRADWLKKAAAAGGDFHYLKKDPRKHNLINLASLASVGVGFGLIFAWGAVASPWIYIPVASALIGALMFSLYVLVIHECSHSMFLLSSDRERSKRINARVGRIAGSLLFTAYVEHWEEGHVAHHLYPCEPERDPQDAVPVDGWDWVKRVAPLFFVPLWSLKLNPSRAYAFDAKRMVLSSLLWFGLAVVGGLFIHWQVGVAMILGFNFLQVWTQTKKNQEHASGLAQEPDPWLRSRTYFYPSRLITSPFFINYHFEHHLNFNVPWYSLPAYHARVLALMPEALKPYCLTRGTVEFVKQIAGKRENVPDTLRYLVDAEVPRPVEAVPVAL